MSLILLMYLLFSKAISIFKASLSKSMKLVNLSIFHKICNKLFIKHT